MRFVDTADRQSRDGLGTFARTTGGELFVFGPTECDSGMAKWKERLNQTVCLGFESTANYADGGTAHTAPERNSRSAKRYKADSDHKLAGG